MGLKFDYFSKKNSVARCTLTPVFVRPLKTLNPEKRRKSIDPTFEAMRLKKMRLRDNAFTIVGLHKNRTRFACFTSIENITSIKEFNYRMENCRKALKKAGYEIEYSGMVERQVRGAWHLHAIAYRKGGKLFYDLPAWDYEQMNAITERYGIHLHCDPINRRTTAAVSAYTSKLDAVITAAYAAKCKNPSEDYCYTLTTKGCDLPKKERYDEQRAADFIEFGKFRKKDYEKNGFKFFNYLSEYENLMRLDYEK